MRMRKFMQHMCTFGAGGLFSLITPLVLLRKGEPVMALYFAVAVLIVMAPICWWPDISNWWRVLRATPATYPHLTVERVMGMDHIWARHASGLLVSVHMSPDDKARPNVREGERISVRGKSTNRFKGGRHEIVQAQVRSHDI